MPVLGQLERKRYWLAGFQADSLPSSKALFAMKRYWLMSESKRRCLQLASVASISNHLMRTSCAKAYKARGLKKVDSFRRIR